MATAGAEYLRASVYFDLDSDSIGPSEAAALDQVANHLNAQPALTIHATGHADRSGREAHNDGLSDRRAIAVEGHLHPLLGAKNREVLSAVGVGESAGADPARCRRVDVLARTREEPAAAEPASAPTGPLPGVDYVAPPVPRSPREKRRNAAMRRGWSAALTPQRVESMLVAGINPHQLLTDVDNGTSPVALDDFMQARLNRYRLSNQANGIGSHPEDITRIGAGPPAHLRHAAHVLDYRLEVLTAALERGLTDEPAAHARLQELAAARAALAVPPHLTSPPRS